MSRGARDSSEEVWSPWLSPARGADTWQGAGRLLHRHVWATQAAGRHLGARPVSQVFQLRMLEWVSAVPAGPLMSPERAMWKAVMVRQHKGEGSQQRTQLPKDKNLAPGSGTGTDGTYTLHITRRLWHFLYSAPT